MMILLARTDDIMATRGAMDIQILRQYHVTKWHLCDRSLRNSSNSKSSFQG